MRQKSIGSDVEALLKDGEPASFFLGGAGDGRHAMATIRDFARIPAIHARLMKGDEGVKTAQGDPGLRVFLNDIKVLSSGYRTAECPPCFLADSLLPH